METKVNTNWECGTNHNESLGRDRR